MPLDLSYGGRLGPAAIGLTTGVVLRPVRDLNTAASSSGVEQVCRTACVAIPSGLRLVVVAKSVSDRSMSHSTAWIGSRAGCDAI